MTTIQERLRSAVPDGTLLDEAADYIDALEALTDDLNLALTNVLDRLTALRGSYPDEFADIDAARARYRKAARQR